MQLFSRWDRGVGTAETNEYLTELASALAERINSQQIRETVSDYINRGDLLGLCTLDVDYESASTYEAITLRQIQSLFGKRVDLEVGIDREAVARSKFREAEELCANTNAIFRERARGNFQFLPGVEPILHRAQQKIARILGDVPTLGDLKFRFGPGATTKVQKRKASAKSKLSEPLACSEAMLPVLQFVLEELPTWSDFNATGVTRRLEPDGSLSERWLVPVSLESGRLSFVPKSYKTDRAIVVEPILNSFVQLAVGDYMVGLLKKAGVDLSTQERNRAAAREGSLTGALATLDLSSASDTIAMELVFDLLPLDWARFLGWFRSGTVEDGDTVWQLEKFSSMGNGYTFPLETLIFYALTCACVDESDEKSVIVYGDDIIVPTYAFEKLCGVLNAVGFIPNKEKSFHKGPFRESCGADYLRGIDIRPCYVKGPLLGADVFRLHNFFVRRGDEELASLVLRWLDPSLRIYGPDGYGDGHLLGDTPWAPHQRSRGWSGYTFETFTWKPKRDFTVMPGDRVYPFYSSYVSGGPAAIRMEPAIGGNRWRVDVQPRERSDDVYLEGRLGVSIPGRQGVNRIKIYTLSRC